MTRSITRLGFVFAAAMGVVALASGYWSVVRREDLISRDDNPRNVIFVEQIRRGAIYDRDGNILAESIIDPETSFAQRQYAAPSVASVVGYYSPRFGSGGVEAAFDEYLSGEASRTPVGQFWTDVLHRPQEGSDVQLTIAQELQEQTANVLNGKEGAIVVVHVPSGDILAMSSSPSFDPNSLDERWDLLTHNADAPLVNRATQGLYQPGMIIQSVVLAHILEEHPELLNETIEGELSITIDGTDIDCINVVPVSGMVTLADAFVYGCPGVWQSVAAVLDKNTFQQTVANFGLLTPLEVSVPSEAIDLQTFDLVPSDDVAGQGQLVITPLHMAAVVAAIANDGVMPALSFVAEVQTAGDSPQHRVLSMAEKRVMSSETASVIQGLMAQSVESGAAREAALAGSLVRGHAGIALASRNSFTSWFIGYVEVDGGEKVVTVVLLEDSNNAGEASKIGGETLHAALAYFNAR